MTHNFKEDSENYSASIPTNGYCVYDFQQLKEAFLAGAARGVEVGEDAFKRAEDERIEWVRRGERAEELCEELKQQLAEAERALKEIKVMSISSEAEQRRNGIFRDWKDIARDYFSKRGAR